MNAIETLKFLLDKALAETPPESRLVWLNVPVEIVQEIIDAQPEKRTDKRTETHACDLIKRQDAIDIMVFECGKWTGLAKEISKQLRQLPSAQPEQKWISCSEKLPDDLEEVNITFTNLAPEPYYDFIKGKRFTGSAVFYKGDWYWYSSITVDVLKEYGRYESEKIDEGLKVVAWKPLPDPYGGEQT